MVLLKKIGFHIYLPVHIIYLLFGKGSSSLETKAENGEICPCHSLLVDWKGKVWSGEVTDEYILFILSWYSNCRKQVHAGNLMASELRRQCLRFHTDSPTSHSRNGSSPVCSREECKFREHYQFLFCFDLWSLEQY